MKIHSPLLLADNCIYLVNSLMVPSDLKEFVVFTTWCFHHLCFQQLASRKLEISGYKQSCNWFWKCFK